LPLSLKLILATLQTTPLKPKTTPFLNKNCLEVKFLFQSAAHPVALSTHSKVTAALDPTATYSQFWSTQLEIVLVSILLAG